MPTLSPPPLDTNEPLEGRDPALEAASQTTAAPVSAPAPPAGGLNPATLLQTLGSGPADPISLLLSQLSANAPEDSNLTLLNQLLQQRRAAEQAAVPEEDLAEKERAQAEAAARVAELTSMVQRLYGEAESLRARCGEMADAVGACPVCFGSDLLCAQCHGRGRPGGRAPRPDAYRVYVLPAVARVKRLMEAHRSPGPEFTRPPGQMPVHSSDKGQNHA